MALVQRFDPPAFLPDFSGIPGQLEAWHNAVSSWFDQVVEIECLTIAKGAHHAQSETRSQFYNPARFDPGLVVEQSIPWNAFPKELLRSFGRAKAMEEADNLRPLVQYSKKYFDSPTAGHLPYRPQTEYCEWHAQRDPDTGAIVKISFTSEPPEYWQALAGTSIVGPDNVTKATFPGDRDLLLQRYRELVSPEVQMDDLFAKEDVLYRDGTVMINKNDYNPYNKWNTTHGIVHLCAPPNALTAEIQLAGDATVLFHNSAKQQLVDPDALICCAAYGGPDRNSDPTIGATVNSLARAGYLVTLRNPVGLYMDHIQLSGWAAPDGKPLDDCVRIVRGTSNLIERLEVSVPPNRGFHVSDIKIAGEPIRYGGQVAECITVHLVGMAGVAQTVKNPSIGCTGRCCIDPNDARTLGRSVRWSEPTPPGQVEAFQDEGAAGVGAIGPAPMQSSRGRRI